MLMALAPPAASAPPITVASISQIEGKPRFATIIVGTVVMSNSSMMRGFVRATYAPMADRMLPALTSRGARIAISLSIGLRSRPLRSAPSQPCSESHRREKSATSLPFARRDSLVRVARTCSVPYEPEGSF